MKKGVNKIENQGNKMIQNCQMIDFSKTLGHF